VLENSSISDARTCVFDDKEVGVFVNERLDSILIAVQYDINGFGHDQTVFVKTKPQLANLCITNRQIQLIVPE